MTTTIGLSTRLARARLRDARGAGVLDGFAVLAFAVTAWMAFVVTSGTWAFAQRRVAPPQSLSAFDTVTVTLMTNTYVILAGIACALLIAPVLSLGGAAARLGARGRARRLAALRLVGMTGGQVVTMSVIESVVQAAVGLLVGAAAWALSLPLLAMLRFQGTTFSVAELVLPWYLWLGVAAVLLALAAASTALGLSRVRISPLGVARQQTTPRLRAWRVAALAVGAVAIVVGGRVITGSSGALIGGLVFVGLLGFGIAMVNLIAPWLLQVLARVGLRVGSPAWLLGNRRIAADPKAAWRNVSSLALTGAVVGMLCVIPLDSSVLAGVDELNLMLLTDIRTGAVVTLVIALIVGAASTALAQCSDVVDRADELVALDRIGVPRSLDAAARRHQVMVPLLSTLVLSMGLGVLAALPFTATFPQRFALGPSSLLVLAGSLVGATLLTVLAAEATRPLRARALSTQVRRND